MASLIQRWLKAPFLFLGGKGKNDKFRRYGVGFDVIGSSFAYDSGFGVLLRRDGQA
jgi:hypothetical protein